jgi:hypothetical protein
MKHKTLVAVTLVSIILSSSSAFAQCASCALYPNLDPLNGNAETPASKMGLEHPGGAASTNSSTNARAEMSVRQVHAPRKNHHR